MEIERTVELDCSPDELWTLVSRADELEGWLAPTVDVELIVGAEGTVVDEEGHRRRLRVDDVVDGRCLRFTWAPEDGTEPASVVTLTVTSRPGGSALVVNERLVASASAPVAQWAWSWRLGLLL